MANLHMVEWRTKKMGVLLLLLLLQQSIFAKSEVTTLEDQTESALNELNDATESALDELDDPTESYLNELEYNGLLSVSENCSDYGIDNLPHPRIILLGPTGVGKSTLANQLLGRNPYNEDDQVFSVGHGVDSHTLNITWAVGNWLGHGPCFTIIDTPGTSDSEGRDYEHALSVANIMKDHIKSVDVFLLCFSGEVPRFDNPTIDLLKLYESIFSKELWNHAVTEVTFWSQDRRSVRKRKRRGMNEMTRHTQWNSQYKEELNVTIEFPSVYIDPVLEMFDAEEIEYLEEREIEAFNNYTDELFEFGSNSEPFICDGNCKAPNGYFLGNPWIETNNVAVRQGEKAAIKCQIWNGIQGKASDNVIWTHNGEVIYEKTTSENPAETTINSTDVWGSKVQFIENVSPNEGHYTDFIIEFESLEETMEGNYTCENERITEDNWAEVFIRVDGTWGEWSELGKCSISCLGEDNQMGSKKRVRKAVAPRNGGNPVNPLDGEETQNCAGEQGLENPIRCPCPVDGKWTSWTSWSSCSATCVSYSPTQSRMRSCTDPAPQYGGKPCDPGPSEESRSCNTIRCPEPWDGQWTSWSSWSGCSATCGFPSPTQSRTRSCTEQYGGKPCDPGPSEESRTCNAIRCPDDQVIFVVGGDTSSRSTEVLDISLTSCSRSTPLMPLARYHHTINNVDGELIVCGGGGSYANMRTCVSSWSPSGPWMHHSNLTTSRYGHSSVFAGGHLHLVAGWWDGYYMETLNNKTWTQHELPYRVGYGSCSVQTGPNEFVVTGGEDSRKKVFKWSIGNVWVQLRNMNGVRFLHGCTTVTINDVVHVVIAGGKVPISFDSLASSELYNVKTGRWTNIGQLATPRITGRMVSLRIQGLTKVMILGGWMVGGRREANETYSVEELFINEDALEQTTWQLSTSIEMNIARSEFGAVEVNKSIACP